MTKYSILLPTYNERENLPIMVYLIHKYLKDNLCVELVICDDSSPDGTLEVAQQLKASYEVKNKFEIQILSRKGKLGLGSAYVSSLKLATGDKVVIMDSDLSHHPKFIPQMIQKMEEDGVDIVSGTRYVAGGGVYGWDFKRKLTSRGANVLAQFLLVSKPFGKSQQMSDLTGSFRLYDRQVLETILPQVKCKGYAFQMEILILANAKGYKISEVPITFVDRLYGESKLGASEIFKYLKGVLTLFFTT